MDGRQHNSERMCKMLVVLFFTLIAVECSGKVLSILENYVS